MAEATDSSELLELTTEIVSSHVANNTVTVNDLPNLIQQVYNTLAAIGKSSAPSAERP
ncbi:MAG: MucR family transcriptional regulator, partial [Alphaproteobacteria bacterium]